ncbi:MAG: DUF21 domain-containing protein [Sphingobacteriia bacterium]|nr:DUF21 domain-containing protein [Sphingobacteriia bacterium]
MATLIILVASISLLLLLAGFFSAAETAITASSQAKMHQLKQSGNKRAGIVMNLRNDKERLIGAILLANNTLNVLASSIVATYMVKVFGEEGVIYATFMMTILIFVFAEVLPKIYAFENPEKVSLAIAPTILFLVKVCSPITVTIRIIGEALMKFFNLKNKDSLVSGSEAIRGAIELSRHEGSMVKSERDMLGGVLDLSDVTVEQIMVHRSEIKKINIDDPISKIVAEALDFPHSRIPLWQKEPDNIVGILHIKSLLKAINDNKDDINKVNIKDLLVDPWFVPNTTLLRDQLYHFRKQRKHFALVIDEYGVLMGLVTLEDILEEIVGQIDDEHDVAKDTISKISDNEYIVNGSETIRDINRDLELNLPEDVANTIAGLLMFELQEVPKEGEIINLYGITFQVLKKNQNQITKVRINIKNRINNEEIE